MLQHGSVVQQAPSQRTPQQGGLTAQTLHISGPAALALFSTEPLPCQQAEPHTRSELHKCRAQLSTR